MPLLGATSNPMHNQKDLYSHTHRQHYRERQGTMLVRGLDSLKLVALSIYMGFCDISFLSKGNIAAANLTTLVGLGIP